MKEKSTSTNNERRNIHDITQSKNVNHLDDESKNNKILSIRQLIPDLLSSVVGGGLVGAGYSLLTKPEEKLERHKRYFYGSSTLFLALYLWLPRNSIIFDMIDLKGTILSSLSGSIFGAGYSLVFKEKDTLNLLEKRVLGGGMLVFGLYFSSSREFRAIWTPANSFSSATIGGALYTMLNGWLIGSALEFIYGGSAAADTADGKSTTTGTSSSSVVAVADVGGEKNEWWRGWKRSVGGAIMGLGLYTFIPPIVRGRFGFI